MTKGYMPVETHRVHGGYQWIYRFDNGYGASVVMHDGSYGGKSGCYEVAVLHDALADWERELLGESDKRPPLCYGSTVTDDVIGWLDWADMMAVLARIDALEADPHCDHTRPPCGWDDVSVTLEADYWQDIVRAFGPDRGTESPEGYAVNLLLGELRKARVIK